MSENKELEIKTLNIYEKLSCICNELSAVAKNLEVGVGQSKYNAVGEADVLKAVKPLEYKYRVYSYPCSRKIIDSGIVENETYIVDYKTKEKEKVVKKTFFERIETIYRFVNIDNKDEFIDITTYGDGIDPQDKSVGKAMTYADKYALLKAYKIITGEDPDQYASEETSTKETPKFEQEYKKVTKEQIEKIQLIAQQNTKTDVIEWLINKCNVEKLSDVPYKAAEQFFEQLEKKKKQNENNQSSSN